MSDISRLVRSIMEDLKRSGRRQRSDTVIRILRETHPDVYHRHARWVNADDWTRKVAIVGRPRCRTCGSSDGPAFRNRCKSFHPWPKFCCMKCGNSNADVMARRKATCKHRYGASCPLGSNRLRAKGRRTLLRHYGVDNPLKSPEVIAQIRATNLRRRGVEWVTQDPDVIEKLIDTHNNPVTLGRRCRTNMRLYGVPYTSQYEPIRRKIVTALNGSKARRKTIKTCQSRYGVDNPIQDYAIWKRRQNSSANFVDMKYRGKHYRLQGYEPEVVCTLVDRGLEVSSRHGIYADYKNRDDGKIHRYFPDLLVRTKGRHCVVEVKSTWTAGLISGRRSFEFRRLQEKAHAIVATGRAFAVMIGDRYKTFRTFKGVPQWDELIREFDPDRRCWRRSARFRRESPSVRQPAARCGCASR